jgi:hypothetical protein
MRGRTTVRMSEQPLLVWHTNLCAAMYACYLSGKREDFVSMAQHVALCLVMLALLPVGPHEDQCQQPASIAAVALQTKLAGKQRRGSGASGIESPTRLVRLKSGACEGAHQGDNGASTGQQFAPPPAVGMSHGRPELALLPGFVSKEGNSGCPFLAGQDESRSLRGSSRDGTGSPGPAWNAEMGGTAKQRPTAFRRVPLKNGVRGSA